MPPCSRHARVWSVLPWGFVADALLQEHFGKAQKLNEKLDGGASGGGSAVASPASTPSKEGAKEGASP